LYPSGFDEESCISRYESLSYHHSSKLNQASPYLVSKLRSYETRHKRCMELYNTTVLSLKHNTSELFNDCKYIVWISSSGLGNRIITVISTFLYALLTDRVLLIDRGSADIMPKLFCEPFPGSSWFLPLDFPLIPKFSDFNGDSPDSFGSLLNHHSHSDLPFQRNYVYLHLDHDYNDRDKLFFCNQHQKYLQNTLWLVITSNNYFIPSLFFISGFQSELNELFPDKETVFHLLGRYMFHPTNEAWALVSRYYNAYLSKADVTVGIQIRVHWRSGMLDYVLSQILSCSMDEGILPQIDKIERLNNTTRNKTSLVDVMIVSLDKGYLEHIRDVYWENPTTTGEFVSVHQPSSEEYQQFGNSKHDMKAWVEMYLLSLTDKLITSAYSTFGYVAQGLSGRRSWVLYNPENGEVPNPPCQRVISMEPCFHAAPSHDCNERDAISVAPYLMHCEDVKFGLKLVEPDKN
ncbi:hypothetical protein M569_03324, partial [Genlisea aurea]